MEAVGMISLVLFALLLLAGVALTVVSLPDINRYRRLKRM